MSNLGRFWRAVESLPALAAVGAEWRDAVGDEWELIRPFLRPRREYATSFPHPDGGLPCRVVAHGDDDYVAVCEETGERYPITRRDLIVYELDWVRVAHEVAQALAIESAHDPGQWDGGVVPLGDLMLDAQTRFPAFLTIPLESSELEVTAVRLISQKQAPFVLLAPTRRWFRRAADAALRYHGCVFAPLVEVLSASRPGRLQRCASLKTLVANATGVLGVRGVEADVGVARNSFRREGESWVVTFAERTIRLDDTLGLRCISHLIARRKSEIPAALLKALASSREALKPMSGASLLDGRAVRECRQEYEDLSSRLEQARGAGDAAAQERLQTQMAELLQHITSGTGLGGRPRTVGGDSEKARTSVTNAIGRVIRKTQKHHPELARHLNNSISTGLQFCYNPEADVEWDL